jgi:hypothetical protein
MVFVCSILGRQGCQIWASFLIGVLISKALKNPVVDPNLETCCSMPTSGHNFFLFYSSSSLFPSSNPEQTTPQPLQNQATGPGQDSPRLGLPDDPDQEAREAVGPDRNSNRRGGERLFLARVVPAEHAQREESLRSRAVARIAVAIDTISAAAGTAQQRLKMAIGTAPPIAKPRRTKSRTARKRREPSSPNRSPPPLGAAPRWTASAPPRQRPPGDSRSSVCEESVTRTLFPGRALRNGHSTVQF